MNVRPKLTSLAQKLNPALVGALDWFLKPGVLAEGKKVNLDSKLLLIFPQCSEETRKIFTLVQ